MSKSFTEQDLAFRISDALRVRAPEYQKKGFIARLADELCHSESAVENWLYGENVPGGYALMRLFAHFGPEFTDEIISLFDQRTTSLVGSPRAAEILENLPRQMRSAAEDIEEAVDKLKGGK